MQKQFWNFSDRSDSEIFNLNYILHKQDILGKVTVKQTSYDCSCTIHVYNGDCFDGWQFTVFLLFKRVSLSKEQKNY